MKKLLIKILLLFIKLLLWLAKSLGYFVMIIIIPFGFLGRLIFKYFLVNIYKSYRLLKGWLKSFFMPAKNKFFFLFSTRYVVHILIIAITILVTTNSIGIKATHAEEFGKNTLLASILGTNLQETVETSEDFKTAETSYLNEFDSLSSAHSPEEEIGVTENEEEMAITKESGGALIKPSIATTTKETPRDEVVYYIVESGDTISYIAEKFNISANTILWENKLGPRDFIKPGDKLTILPLSGLSHQVKKGDTLEKIAEKYGVEVGNIMEYNKLADAQAIEADEILLIPGGEMPKPPPPKSESYSSRFALFEIPAPARVPPGSRLLWPTGSHKINQYYSWRHAAIDIDGSYSSPIYASETGRVVSAGWGRGYGNQITVDHGAGMKTLYAHLSKTFVQVGDSVKKGQTIGMIGCTGWCTGTHLHFEIFINGKKINPLSYL